MSDVIERKKCRLEQWAVRPRNPYAPPESGGKVYLSGAVYGYPGRPDGEVIDTGSIYGATGRVAIGKRTEYELGEPHPDYLAWMESHGMTYDPAQPIRFLGEN